MMLTITVIIFLVAITMPDSAHAYLDPGSGSFIVQILIGFIAGSLVALKVYWSKIIGFIKKPLSRRK